MLILTDYTGRFATKMAGTLENHYGVFSMDTEKMCAWFNCNGYHCEINAFSELDMTHSWRGWYVLYASSEDRGKFYKQYIEDVLLRLDLDGAILLPSYRYARAHTNKSLQEMLRCSFENSELHEPHAYAFGHFDELRKYNDEAGYPCIVKCSSGSGSSGVVLCNTHDELLKTAKRLMGIQYSDFSTPLLQHAKLFIWRAVKIVMNHTQKQPLSSRLMTNKIIIQQFIKGLTGDYKVLVFGDKYYVLRRANRSNDFRASGSGDFAYPKDIESIAPVLELARQAAAEIHQPVMSLDIGMVEETKKCYLLEYQCVYFGPLTLQYSDHYYVYKNHTWNVINGNSDLEDEYCVAVSRFVQEKTANEQA